MKLVLVALGALISVSVVAVPALQTFSAFTQKQKVLCNGQTIVVEVAATQEDRERGLSGRTHLSINEGMLFLFDTPGFYSFWMKDMLFPIDIVWLDGNRIVGVTERIDPQVGALESTLAVLTPPQPVTRVLELAAGRARLLGAAAGGMVSIRTLGAGE
jgi:uncharacterized protein